CGSVACGSKDGPRCAGPGVPRRVAPVKRAFAAWVFLAALGPPAAFAAVPPTPESFLGFKAGADRKLADYGQITRYFEQLDAGSHRVSVRVLGETTLGRKLIMAMISSPENLRDAARYQTIAQRLADPRGLGDDEARRLVLDGKVVCIVTCNIHASEIAASQMAMEWAYDLATSDDPKVKRW